TPQWPVAETPHGPDYLSEENRVLREQLGHRRHRLTDGHRRRGRHLNALGRSRRPTRQQHSWRSGSVVVGSASIQRGRPSSFTAALFTFLLRQLSGDPLDAGLALRRAVLGNEHLDQAIASTNEFTRDFQEMIITTHGEPYGPGPVWTRVP